MVTANLPLVGILNSEFRILNSEFQGGESHGINDRVHGISCRLSDKSGKEISHNFHNNQSIFMQ